MSCLYILLSTFLRTTNNEWIKNFRKNINVRNNRDRTNSKTILVWNPVYVTANGMSSEISKNCPHIKCIVTHDKRLISHADAVLIEPEGLSTLPRKTKLGQVWIFTHREPPPLAYADGILKFDAKFFNWTMTYRRDSDIQFYYGVVRPQKESNKRPLVFQPAYPRHSVSKGFLRNTTPSMIWFVSHCKVPGDRKRYYTTQKKFRITYYIIFVHTTLSSCSYA